jgi:two-component sensor histidine kinase
MATRTLGVRRLPRDIRRKLRAPDEVLVMLHLVETQKPQIEDGRDMIATAVGTPDPALAIKDYDVLDTPPEAAFDRITALAADLFDAPIAIISFFDRDRLSFKSHHGLEATGISWGSDTSASAMELRIRREFDVGFFVGVPLRTPDGHDLGTLCVIDRKSREAEPHQIRQLRVLGDIVVDLLEQRLAKLLALARANLMSSEVDHRVMNSLQFVASLLNLQSRTAIGTEAAHQLTTAANRVLAVARVHRNFSADESADRVPVLAYLRRLCDELSVILGVAITIHGTEATIPMARITAIGLIINELATNAKKHGDGAIDITFSSPRDGDYELCVLDHGPGLPPKFSLDRPSGKGLGIKVIAALVGQLQGKLSAGPGPAGRGACFTVIFPAA